MKENYISNELKEKIINSSTLTKEELEKFFKYLIYKVKKITTYKEKLNDNLSKEYTALCSEILFSHNIDAKKQDINNHYYCIANINNDYYLFDLLIDKYNHIKLNKKIYEEYIKYIKENYYE